MAKAKQKLTNEADSTYFLKLVLYLIVGSQWVWLVDVPPTNQIPLPIGFIIGIFFASHDHFQIDRKIEYAVLLIAMFIGWRFNAGIFIQAL